METKQAKFQEASPRGQSEGLGAEWGRKRGELSRGHTGAMALSWGDT